MSGEKHEQDHPGPPPNEGEGVDQFLERFATVEARRVLSVTKWFLYAAIVAIAIEVLVSFLDEYPKLTFVTFVLDWLGRFVLVCDAIVFALFVLVATLLAIHTLLMLLGINVVSIGRWLRRKLVGMRAR